MVTLWACLARAAVDGARLTAALAADSAPIDSHVRAQGTPVYVADGDGFTRGPCFLLGTWTEVGFI